MDSVGEGEGGKIWENGIETCVISCMKRVASPGSMHDTGTCQWRVQASALLLHRGSYHWACNLRVLIVYLFFLPVMLSSVLPRLATDSAVGVFLGVWKLLSF